MSRYQTWLVGFGCGLVATAILRLFFWDSGVGVGAAFGVLILVIAGARAVFARRSSNAQEQERTQS